jgi:hypothetical protein
MDSIAKLIPAILKASGGDERMLESACISAWNLAVGEATWRGSRPVSLSGKTLTVAAIDAHWKRQLENLARQILFKLNSVLGQPAVTRIHIILDAEFVRAGQAVSLPEVTPAPRPPADITAAAAVITDEKLREQFLRTAGRCLSRTDQ